MAASAVSVIASAHGSPATFPGKNGRIAFVSDNNPSRRLELYSVGAGGMHLRRLTHSSTRRYIAQDPAFSPNGRWIVFARAVAHPAHPSRVLDDLWAMKADGSHLRRLTRTRYISEVMPSWSPDGRRIVFAICNPSTKRGLWVIGRDGRHRRRLARGCDLYPSWSPDGRSIAFVRPSSVSDCCSDIDVIPAAGGTVTNLTSDSSALDQSPDWSPDGTRIVFTRAPTGPSVSGQVDLWVMDADGSSKRQITNTPGFNEVSPRWSPDGTKLVYSGVEWPSGDASSQLYVSDANGANPHPITSAPGTHSLFDGEPTWQPRTR